MWVPSKWSTLFRPWEPQKVKIWVPGDWGIEADEVADELARNGANQPCNGSEPDL